MEEKEVEEREKFSGTRQDQAYYVTKLREGREQRRWEMRDGGVSERCKGEKNKESVSGSK